MLGEIKHRELLGRELLMHPKLTRSGSNRKKDVNKSYEEWSQHIKLLSRGESCKSSTEDVWRDLAT